MDRKTLNILGCCVLRDTFGMHEGDGGYEIGRYVQIPSPVSLVTKSPLLDETAEIDDAVFGGKSKFLTRCQKLELKKQVFDFLGGVVADYIIIDCAEFRKNLFYFPAVDGWFTESHKDLLEKYIESGLIPESYEMVDPMKIDRKMVYVFLKSFCEEILTLYDKEHIILYEIKAVDLHTDGKSMNVFNGKHEIVERYNERMSFCYEYVKAYLQGCHIIEFPNGVVADTNHKWGKAVLHYVPEYYDYSLKAIDIITNRIGDRPEEESALKCLKRHYEVMLQRKYNEILRITLERNESKRHELDRLWKYVPYFQRLLIDDGKEKVRILLESRHISVCALYGKTQVAMVLVRWLRNWGITIKYIVEDFSTVSVWDNIPLVKRSDLNLLNCENMIICDANDKAVREKLIRLGYKGTILSFNELL